MTTLEVNVSDSITVTDSPRINWLIVKKFVMRITRSVLFHSHIG